METLTGAVNLVWQLWIDTGTGLLSWPIGWIIGFTIGITIISLIVYAIYRFMPKH
jgi:hypothetical protein